MNEFLFGNLLRAEVIANYAYLNLYAFSSPLS